MNFQNCKKDNGTQGKELLTLLVDILAVLFNLILLGVTSLLKYLLVFIKSFNLNNAPGNNMTIFSQEVNQSSQYYSSNGESYLRTAQYNNVQIMPSQNLYKNVIQKSWSLTQLKSQIEFVQREITELKYKIENDSLNFNRYCEGLEKEISGLNNSLNVIIAEQQELKTNMMEENGNVDRGVKPDNGEDLEVVNCADNKVNIPDPEHTPTNIENEPKTKPIEAKKKRTNYTLCQHILCKDLLVFPD
ncbi:hypothetical protein WDU94_008820 [Cyamophila willieti]